MGAAAGVLLSPLSEVPKVKIYRRLKNADGQKLMSTLKKMEANCDPLHFCDSGHVLSNPFSLFKETTAKTCSGCAAPIEIAWQCNHCNKIWCLECIAQRGEKEVRTYRQFAHTYVPTTIVGGFSTQYYYIDCIVNQIKKNISTRIA